jgi:hypothetical protein
MPLPLSLVTAAAGLLAASLSARAQTVPAASTPPATLYVSTVGDDRWSGTLAEPNPARSDGPFATVARARDRIRELRPPGGARVLLRGGTYPLRTPLVFTADDAGTPGAPHRYESFPGETATLAGTRVLTGPWRAEGGAIQSAPLGDLGGALPRTVFLDGRRATWARFPNQGSLRATGGQGKTRIQLAPGTARPGWATDPSATVNIIAERGWYNQIVRVAGVGAAGEWIDLAGRETQGQILAGNRFHVEGVRAELDAEGEWYLDHASGRLLVHSARPLAERRVEVAVVDRLIDVRGTPGLPAGHLVFRGLRLFGSDFTVDHVAVRTNQDAAIHLVNAHEVEVAECRFESVGGYGVWLHLDARDNVIRGNEMVDGGAGGVLVTGARFSYLSAADLHTADPAVQELAPGGNVILGNHIHHGGVIRAYCSGVHLDSRPLSRAQARGNYVGFNHLHDLPRNGIFAFRNQGGNLFEANHIHDVIQRTNDGGAIHLASMNPLCAPTHILDNRIHRVGYQGGNTKVDLAFGIYPDWFTSRMLIRGNVISDTRDGGIRLLGGGHTVIEDNLVGDDPTASIAFGYWTTNSVRGMVVRNNRVVNGQGQWVRYFTSGGGPKTDAVVARPGEHWESAGNTYWGRGTGGGLMVARESRGARRPEDRLLTLADVQRQGAEAGSVERDFGADGNGSISTQPGEFGAGSATFRRLQQPVTVEDARRRLRELEGAAVFVSFEARAGVTYGEGWQPEPTKINEYLAFADLRQAVARRPGGALAFATDLAPGRYAVFLQWYGAAAERVPELDVELTAPGAEPRRVAVNHRREGHKWVRAGEVEVRAAGRATVSLRHRGDGLAAIHAVAWVREPAGGSDL